MTGLAVDHGHGYRAFFVPTNEQMPALCGDEFRTEAAAWKAAMDALGEVEAKQPKRRWAAGVMRSDTCEVLRMIVGKWTLSNAAADPWGLRVTGEIVKPMRIGKRPIDE